MYRSQRNYENLEKRLFNVPGKYGILVIEPTHLKRKIDFIPFNYAKTIDHPENKGIHFFLDDYQFNRVWARPRTYLHMIQKFAYVMSPDFSIYVDFPLVIQLYNHYRKHWLAAYWQENGVEVIPSISWGNEDSFEWCFDGEPHYSTVAVSSVGTQSSQEGRSVFLQGYMEMMRRLEPEAIIFYGDVPEQCKGNIIPIESFQEKFKKIQYNPADRFKGVKSYEKSEKNMESL